MADPVRRALADAVPHREVREVDPVPASGHPGNRTARVRFADGTAYCTVAVDGERERVARGAAGCRYAAARCDVRVPDVMAADPEGDPPYLLTGALAGTPVADGWADADLEERARRLRDVGRAVAGVHAARFEEPGRVLGGDAAGLDLRRGGWTEVLVGTIESRAEALFDDRFDDVPGRVCAALRAHRATLDRAPAALLHEDPHRDNVLRHPDGPGLVDWDRALVGDPVLELCRTASVNVDRPDVPVDDRDRLRSALLAGYRERAGSLPAGFDERRPLYRPVVFLAQARTFGEWAPGAPEPTGELASWVRQEFERRLDRL